MRSLYSKIFSSSKIETPVVDVPTQALTSVRADVSAKRFAPGAEIRLSQYLPDKATLPDGVNLWGDATIKVGGDGTIDGQTLIVNGKDTNIKIDEVEVYLKGDSFAGQTPRIRELYARMGVPSSVLDSPVFKDAFTQIDKNFLQTKASRAGARERQIEVAAKQMEEIYGAEGKVAFERYALAKPDDALKLVTKLFEKDKKFMNDMLDTPEKKGLWESVKRNPIRTAILAFLAIAVPGITVAVDKHRKEVNGCRVWDPDEGWLGKVELLTCDDDLNDATSEKVPLVETCETQNYPAQTAVACSPDRFNPCLVSGQSRASATQVNYPFVPDVCKEYLYRKTRGAKDTSTEVSVIDACATTKEDGVCSKYCNQKNFKEMFKSKPDLKLKCRNLNWAAAFFDWAADILEDTICDLIPFSCSEPGEDKTDWWKRITIVVVILLILGVIYYLYKKFSAQNTGVPTRTDPAVPNKEELLTLLREQMPE